MKQSILVFCGLLLAACQSGPYPVDSPYYRIPVGSQIIVKQPLTISANQARVYIQSGKPVSNKELDQYHPHCWFLSWQRLKQNQVIKPDTFNITRVQYFEEVVLRQIKAQYASLGQWAFRTSYGSATAVEYKTELTIKSEKNPEIRRLVCNHWEDPNDARHLKISEIKAALGKIAELVLKTNP